MKNIIVFSILSLNSVLAVSQDCSCNYLMTIKENQLDLMKEESNKFSDFFNESLINKKENLQELTETRGTIQWASNAMIGIEIFHLFQELTFQLVALIDDKAAGEFAGGYQEYIEGFYEKNIPVQLSDDVETIGAFVEKLNEIVQLLEDTQLFLGETPEPLDKVMGTINLISELLENIDRIKSAINNKARFTAYALELHNSLVDGIENNYKQILYYENSEEVIQKIINQIDNYCLSTYRNWSFLEEQVPFEVPLIGQTNQRKSWVAAAAMVYEYATDEYALSSIKQSAWSNFRLQQISSKETTIAQDLFLDWELVALPFCQYRLDFLNYLLIENGPLFIASEKKIHHAIVIVGMAGGTEDELLIYINDTREQGSKYYEGGGDQSSQYVLTKEQFVQRFGNSALKVAFYNY